MPSRINKRTCRGELADQSRAILPRPAYTQRDGVRGLFPTAQARKLTPHPEPALRSVSDLSPQAGRGDRRRSRLSCLAAGVLALLFAALVIGGAGAEDK